MTYRHGDRVIISPHDLEELEAENERLSLENQSLREKIAATGYSPNHDTEEIREVERILRQMVKRDAAKIKQLTTENDELLDVVAKLTAELEKRPVGELGY